MKNFWAELPKPFFALAPLANVTDAAFRRIIAKYSKIGHPMTNFVTYTEFVSADGLCRAPAEGRQKLMRDLLFTDAERPIVAQFFTSTPEHMEKAAALAQELGFDGVDINMGCPDKTIEKQGAGAKLIQNPIRAQELIVAAKRGLARGRPTAEGAPNLPISVKTRLGYNKDVLEEWLPVLLAAEPAAITIHARTRKEMSKVPARWERVRRAVEIRNECQGSTLPKTLIVGNGDALDVEDAKQKAAASGADGVMLGRAIFGRPWLFDGALPKLSGKIVWPDCPAASGCTGDPRTFSQEVLARLAILVEHTKLFEELLGDIKSFAIMKKHFKAYVQETFSASAQGGSALGGKELRIKLMDAENAAEVERLVEKYILTNNEKGE